MPFGLPFSGKDFTEDLRTSYKISPEETIYFYKGILKFNGFEVQNPPITKELEDIATGKMKMIGFSGSTLEIIPE